MKKLLVILFFFPLYLFSESEILGFNSGKYSSCIFYQKYSNDTFISVVNEVENSKGDIVINTHVKDVIISSVRYDLVNNSNDRAYGAMLDFDEKSIVIYGSVETTDNFVFKYNLKTKNINFCKFIRNIENYQWNRFYKLIKLKNTGDYVGLGLIHYSQTSYLLRLKCTNGAVVWSREYDFKDHNELTYSVVEDGDGNLVLGGGVLTGTYKATIVKLNPNDGSVLFNNTFNTGSIDDGVLIKGTNLIAFLSSYSNNSGLILFNYKTNQIQDFAYFKHSLNTRTINIYYSESNNKIIAGGYFNMTKLNMFFQEFDLNNIHVCNYYTFKNIDVNNTSHVSDRVYPSGDENYYYFAGMHSKDNDQTSEFLVSTTSHNIDKLCFTKNTANKQSYSQSVSTQIEFLIKRNISTIDVEPKLKSVKYSLKKACDNKCKATKKEVKIGINTQKDSVCKNNDYNLKVNILQNTLNKDIKLSLRKLVGSNYIEVDQIIGKLNFNFNILKSLIDENFQIISTSECSMNDTQYFKLEKYRYNYEVSGHQEFYCQGEILNMNVVSTLGKLNFKWMDLDNNLLLSADNILNFQNNQSFNLKLIIENYCNENLDSVFKIHYSNLYNNNPLLIDTINCQILNTKLVYPQQQNQNNFRYSFFWEYYLNNNKIGSKKTEVNQILSDTFFKFENAGNYNFEIREILPNQKTCYQKMNKIIVHPRAIANFQTNKKRFVIDSSLLILSNKSQNATNFEWYINNQFESNLTSFDIKLPEINKYSIKLIARNEFNCNDTTEQLVEVFSSFKLFIPNSFSPTFNGKNPVWKPFIGNNEYVELIIYNRWGEKIYEQIGNDIDWDGTYQNEDCPEGVYLYLLKIKSIEGDIYYPRGTITLIR